MLGVIKTVGFNWTEQYEMFMVPILGRLTAVHESGNAGNGRK